MAELSVDAAREIEQIHSSWIAFEIAGEDHRLITLCADDIELWPPDGKPVAGLTAVSARMAQGETRIHSIETTDRRIRGSNEIAYLTSNYRTTFSVPEDPNPRQSLGNHLWILRKRVDGWVVVLVAWSSWGAGREACQTPPAAVAGDRIL
jgi:ketosteroid isomerase-like protein